MSSAWAEENLAAIRTLMERASLYRRALAPLFLLAGGFGVLAAMGGIVLHLDSATSFTLYWSAVGATVGAVSFLVVRQQALKAGEPFWTPPARRVFRALLPAFSAGIAASLCALEKPPHGLSHVWLPGMWMILYGTAFHAAAFFLPRGCQWVAWGFACPGMVVMLLHGTSGPPPAWLLHAEMGLAFGGVHVAAGAFLTAQQRRTNPG